MKAPKRPPKTAGLSTYKAYVERLRTGTGAIGPVGPIVQTCVFAAVCSGSAALGREIGLPLALIGMARDPDAAVERLNACRHGSCVPFRSMSQAFECEDGWDDWSILRFGGAMASPSCLSTGISIGRGVLVVSTRGDAPLADMRSSLAASLRHMRLHEVASAGGAVLARHPLDAPLVVPPRYTPLDHPGCRTCRRVDDLYAFDPWADLMWLGVTIEASALDVGATVVATRR